ncbi:hypothetical protein SKAU_G00174640 [Synaphobranchus kaupii]|uniref:Uncharacterized protein n=1 Tax=Synaphobranchus kaupii TaxID=118154 RepID=A0A9Q1FLM9_SYNKA|nr:hypothetical protein SKAU_G00174640 [Synaphobranchus kaupii]
MGGAMEDVYVGFESYNFNEDTNYLNGLKHLRLTDESYDRILKLKIFYYNRFVRPIDLEGYLQWFACHKAHRTQTRDDGILELKDKYGKLCIQRDNANPDRGEENSPETDFEERRQPICEAPTPCPQTGVNSAVTNTESRVCQSLSFAEVFRLIQAGEVVPGVQKLDIQPCHHNPTTSKLTRRPKPWEKTTAS